VKKRKKLLDDKPKIVDNEIYKLVKGSLAIGISSLAM